MFPPPKSHWKSFHIYSCIVAPSRNVVRNRQAHILYRVCSWLISWATLPHEWAWQCPECGWETFPVKIISARRPDVESQEANCDGRERSDGNICGNLSSFGLPGLIPILIKVRETTHPHWQGSSRKSRFDIRPTSTTSDECRTDVSANAVIKAELAYLIRYTHGLPVRLTRSRDPFVHLRWLHSRL